MNYDGRIREVTVYSNGDSRKISTWSNVPYFFIETLISKGIKVNRVDLSPSFFLKAIFKLSLEKILKVIYKNSTYYYFRSLIHFTDLRYRIRKAIRQYPNADANIFLTFSFSSAGLTDKPSIQFCDWTYDYYFKYFLDREPNYFEQQSIKRENAQIEGSDLIFPLFPSVMKHMKKTYENENIYYLGNVVNTLHEVAEIDILASKDNSNNILFIGSKLYIKGAVALIQAFEKILQYLPQLHLHIIGMDAVDFRSLPKSVICHGYLDKGKNDDQALYYKLLREAKLFVNTTPKWGAFSATIEAMYFYTPVITSPYDDFVDTFGRNIDFGYYCEQNSPGLIEENIMKIFSNNSYKSLCVNAYKSVEGFTWKNYIDKLIQISEDIICTS